MKARSVVMVTAMAAGLLWAAFPSSGATVAKLSGSIGGKVTNSSGIPQMGASVLLFNRYERLIERALTDDKGGFLFSSLTPDLYSVRINLVSFVPAVKQGILVQPGMRSLLNVSLASVLSSVELVYMAPAGRPVMSDEWKWVLRSAGATRPVLRFRPQVDYSDPASKRKTASSAFSSTRGIVKVSAGDQGHVSALGNEPDLGTAFAVATSLFGNNQLQVSGNVGYSQQSGMPVAGFRTSYSRELPGGSKPEVKLTMRQIYLPSRAGTGFVNAQLGGAPALRTMSLGLLDRARLAENVRFEYGFYMESVQFFDRLNFVSPYGRLTYDNGALGSLVFGYSSGAPPIDLLAASDGKEMEPELYQDLAALALFPRVSLRHGQARIQRAESFEVGYHKTAGSRTFSAGIYRERVANAALTMVAPGSFYAAGDLVPDLFSSSWVFNAGKYHSTGYMASAAQAFGEHLTLTFAYGSGVVLKAARSDLSAGTPEELRALIRTGRRNWAAVRLSGTSPWTGTQFATSYQWTEARSLTPGHLYVTQTMRPEAGFNVYIRQPVPALSCRAGRLEANADLRNLLAQGYLPLGTAQGRRLLLMHSPRSVRGGLSFIF